MLALLQADLRERLRSPRPWWLLASMAAVTVWALPSASADYLVLTVGEHWRGRWSSAWIGMTFAVLHGALLPLAGFYVVRGTVVRDLDTRVWQLLVATPMSRAGYLLAKWASHVAVLALVLAMSVLVGLVLQQVHGEDRHVDLVELLEPVWLIALPPIGLSAALAVVFDLVPWLRRSAGNAVFFLAWLGVVGGTDATGNGTLEQALAQVPGLPVEAGRVGADRAGRGARGALVDARRERGDFGDERTPMRSEDLFDAHVLSLGWPRRIRDHAGGKTYRRRQRADVAWEPPIL
jgi:hypothetical protein